MSESVFSSQHTNTFPQILQQLGISLAVSTYQAGQLIFLRNHAGRLNTHFTALERPMGLASDGRRLAIGTSHQAWTYKNMPAVTPKVPAVDDVPYDACYIPQQMHITGDIDIHEMAFGLNAQGQYDELWIVNTKMSCLCTLDKDHSVVPRWRPKFISAYDLTDRCHLNGLALKDGKPKYVTVLGETDTAGGLACQQGEWWVDYRCRQPADRRQWVVYAAFTALARRQIVVSRIGRRTTVHA